MTGLRTDDIKKLHQKKYRQQFGCFLAEGEHLVLELQKAAVTNPALLDSELYVTASYENWSGPLKKNVINEKLMAQLSDTRSPQGIIACVPLAALRHSGQAASMPAEALQRAIYLFEIRDPGNLGTILRTLAWFGGCSCLLSPGCVDPFNAKVVRASMGAIFHVAIELDVDVPTLARRYTHIASLDMHGSKLTSDAFHQAQCLVFGNEARGVPGELLAETGAQAFTIPGAGDIESLNVAAAVNMCLYELNRAP
ncbi:MAG: RNA methyltransferase [Pseudohongiella sp.]|uniref:TrmH family RNA methyltransferase n=1 Tax=Pseudohongiella sp. TaxID=1979412 RepID=UPI00349FE20C